MKKRKNKSILSLGGIAKGRKVGTGNERDYTKKIVAEKVMKEGLTKQHKEYYFYFLGGTKSNLSSF